MFGQPFKTGEATVTVTAHTRPDHVQDAVEVTWKVLLLPPGS